MAAGLALSLLTVGGMVGNTFFGKVYQNLGKFMITFDLVVAIIELIIVYYANSIMYIYIGTTIVGIGFMLIIPTLMMDVGKIAPPAGIPLASGFIIAFMNIGSFLSTYYISFVGKISGNMN
ncbi:MAG: hypothetical protein ACOWWH_08600, partial [Eubacteriaceae bacterium]